MADMVIYEGRQYPANALPKGADPSKAVPAAQWFADNRRQGLSEPRVPIVVRRRQALRAILEARRSGDDKGGSGIKGGPSAKATATSHGPRREDELPGGRKRPRHKAEDSPEPSGPRRSSKSSKGRRG